MKRTLYIIVTLIGLFSLSGLVFAQGDGSFNLRSGNSTGGSGVSENGRFTLHGSIEQHNNSSLSGGDFSATGGIWSTVCLKPNQLSSTAIALSGGQIQLDWTVNNGNSFNIYRASNNFYFDPSTVYDTDDATPWLDSENSAIGDPSSNQTYLIRVSNPCGESEISQRVAEFDFIITPGN